MREIARSAGDGALVPKGFARKELRWVKPVAEGVDWVVEVEKEKHTHSKDEIGFTVAWGVDVAGFWEIFGQQPPRHAWGCVLNGRITDLAKRPGGWWIVTSDGTTWFGSKRRPTDEQMADDIAERLENHLMPFLSPLTSRAAVAALIERSEFLRKRGVWPSDPYRQLDHVAGLLLLDGDIDGALERVATIRARAAARGISHRVAETTAAIERWAAELRGDGPTVL